MTNLKKIRFTARSKYYQRLYFFIGIYSTIGVLLPYFGRSFNLFGVHNRIISLSIIVSAVLISLPKFSISKARNGLFTFVLLLFSLIFLYAEDEHYKFLMMIQPDLPFYEGKLARIVQFTVPTLLMGYIVSVYRSNDSFVRGVWFGCIFCGILAFGIFWSYRMYFFGQTTAVFKEFSSIRLFSPLSFSVLISVCTICIMAIDMSTKLKLIGVSVILVVLLGSILVLRQRTHLIVICIYLLLWVIKLKKAKILTVILLFGVALAVGTILFGDLVFSETVIQYWEAAIDGHMVNRRLEIFMPTLEQSVEKPWGHGLGSHALYFEDEYPHNLFLEAFFELGIIGAILTGVIFLYAMLHIIRLVSFRRSARGKVDNIFISRIIVLLLIHVLKADEMSGIYLFLYFVFIAPKLPIRFADLKYKSRVRSRNLNSKPIAVLN